MSLLLISSFCAILSILAAALIFNNLRKTKIRSIRIAELAGDIALGVRTYLQRQFRTILLLFPLSRLESG